jgi:hypothetical protein
MEENTNSQKNIENETILINQLLNEILLLDKWYIIDLYIDKYISCVDDRESYKIWIRQVRKNKKGPLYIKIKEFFKMREGRYQSKYLSTSIILTN